MELLVAPGRVLFSQVGWNKSEQTKFLDRGDGTCYHFDENTKLCLIYENRPLVCRVEQYYQTYLKEIYEWDEFVKLNLEICQKL